MDNVKFYYATMNSGKTANACITAYQYEREHQAILCFTSSRDERNNKEVRKDGDGFLIGRWESRIEGLGRDVYLIGPETDIVKLVLDILYKKNILLPKLKCIMIDECQFLSPKQVRDIVKFSDMSQIEVRLYGLLSTFQVPSFDESKLFGLFPASAQILALGVRSQQLENIGLNGDNSHINTRIVDGRIQFEGEVFVPGAEDIYKPIPRVEMWRMLDEISNHDSKE